jgi:hypothetical protein
MKNYVLSIVIHRIDGIFSHLLDMALEVTPEAKPGI